MAVKKKSDTIAILPFNVISVFAIVIIVCSDVVLGERDVLDVLIADVMFDVVFDEVKQSQYFCIAVQRKSAAGVTVLWDIGNMESGIRRNYSFLSCRSAAARQKQILPCCKLPTPP